MRCTRFCTKHGAKGVRCKTGMLQKPANRSLSHSEPRVSKRPSGQSFSTAHAAEAASICQSPPVGERVSTLPHGRGSENHVFHRRFTLTPALSHQGRGRIQANARPRLPTAYCLLPAARFTASDK